MKITLYVLQRGLIKAVQSGNQHFVGMFERPTGNHGIYMQMEFPLEEVIVTEDVPYAQFPLTRFVKKQRLAANGSVIRESEFNFIPAPELEKVVHAQIEPAPHVDKI